MENHKLVLREHLNHYGSLFGGYLLMWVDEVAWIAGARDFPGCRLVTIAMDHVEFKKSVPEGTILSLRTTQTCVGNTSVSYEVSVRNETEVEIFSTTVTLVRVDEHGDKERLTL